jgi:hypothetical protein
MLNVCVPAEKAPWPGKCGGKARRESNKVRKVLNLKRSMTSQHSINRLINQSINQSIINQSVNQSINRVAERNRQARQTRNSTSSSNAPTLAKHSNQQMPRTVSHQAIRSLARFAYALFRGYGFWGSCMIRTCDAPHLEGKRNFRHPHSIIRSP